MQKNTCPGMLAFHGRYFLHLRDDCRDRHEAKRNGGASWQRIYEPRKFSISRVFLYLQIVVDLQTPNNPCCRRHALRHTHKAD